MSNLMRLSIRICMFINCIMLAIFSIWLVGNFLMKFMGWLDRVFFSSDW